jgi:hypothetical protein
MWSKIKSFFKKLWKAIKKVIVAILLIVAVILLVWSAIVTGGATLVILGFTITPAIAMVIGVLAVVGAFLIDAEYAKELTGKIGDAVADAAGAIAEVVAEVGSEVAEKGILAVIKSPVGIAAIGIGAYFLFFNKKSSPSNSDQPVFDPDTSSSQNSYNSYSDAAETEEINRILDAAEEEDKMLLDQNGVYYA